MTTVSGDNWSGVSTGVPTPALSPGERGNYPPVLGALPDGENSFDTHSTVRLPLLSPLPEEEGQGEGEAFVLPVECTL